MQGGANGSTVGAVRAIEIGQSRLLEQLDALDDDKHTLYVSAQLCTSSRPCM